MFGKWPHEFLKLSVFEQNLAVLCAADREASIVQTATAMKAMPALDISEIA
jgi:hypothetical protein